MKYPIGIQTFERIRTEGYVYVDKTALVYKLVSEGSTYFLCRPRRFGKSLLVSTLHSYFDGRKDLFEGLQIMDLETEWKTYPVFHFDFNGAEYTQKDSLRKRIEFYLRKYEALYGGESKEDELGNRFQSVLERAYATTGNPCVVLIDEYDKPILDALETPMEEENKNLLKAFYSTFKGADASLKFVLLTGVTKFSQVSVFSGFNQPDDISMESAFDAICGITAEELKEVFKEPIKEFASKLECTEEELLRMLQRHYDGYHFSEAMTDIYNPFSLLSSFKKQKLEDYWFKTGTPTYLVKLLSHTKEDLNQLTGKYYTKDSFADYRADVERPLPMIYQSGYLTIKGYEADTDDYLLDIPNNEVRRGFINLVASGYFHCKDEEPMSWCRNHTPATPAKW